MSKKRKECLNRILIDGYVKLNVTFWVPHSIVDSILVFYGIYNVFFESELILNDKIAFMELICNQLNDNNIILNRIYSSNIHGLSCKEFHKYCDNKGKTIILMKRDNDYIFGGYTKVPQKLLPSRWKYISDSSAFLFNIHPNMKVFPIKTDFVHKAIYQQSQDYFVSFGSNDLWLFYNNGIAGYSAPKYYNIDSLYDFIGNSVGYSIKIIDMEVFQVN